MPEVYVQIIWPNEAPDRVYSPSSIIKNYFKTGDVLTVEQFQNKADEALLNASKRVKEKFGFECTSAMGEMERLKEITDKIENKNLKVRIINVE